MSVAALALATAMTALMSAAVLGSEVTSLSVVYVPDSAMYSEDDIADHGLMFAWANHDFRRSRSAQMQALAEILGGREIEREVVRAIPCPGFISCPEADLVVEKRLEEYLATHTTTDVQIVRISRAGIGTKALKPGKSAIFEIGVSVTRVPAGPDRGIRHQMSAVYIDWEATRESVTADYDRALREVSEMVAVGIPLADSTPTNTMPGDWASTRTLKEIRQKGARQCVPNPAYGGKSRVLRQDDVRIWLGYPTPFGPSFSSNRLVTC